MVGFDIERRGRNARRRESEKPFVGRQRPIETFRIALSQPQSVDSQAPDGYRVLAWDGPGGLGKSRLCAELRKEVRGRREFGKGEVIALGHLDFQGDDVRQDRILALCSLRRQLAASARIKTPAFTYALGCLFALENPGVDLRERHPEMFQTEIGQGGDDICTYGWDLMKAVVTEGAEEVIKFIPGGNIVVRNLQKGLNWALNKRELSAIRETIEDLDEMRDADDKAGLRAELARCLGEDLSRAMAAENEPPRVVLMFDTYEALWGTAKSENDLSVDKWVRDLIRYAPGAMVTVFGRQSLRWTEVEPEWAPFLRKQRLEDLTKAEADEYLRKSGVPDEGVRNRIVNASEGLPFYLDVSVEIYRRLRREGRTPGVEDFAPAKAQILERFISGLDTRQRQELMVASYPDQLSDDTFMYLSDEFLGGVSTTDWTGLKRQSFLTEVGDGCRLHNLMRLALQKQARAENPAQFSRIHRGLHSYHADKLPTDRLSGFSSGDKVNFQAAHRHLIACDLDEATEWLDEQSKDCFRSGRWSTIQEAFYQTRRAYMLHDRPMPSSMERLEIDLEDRNQKGRAIGAAMRKKSGQEGMSDLREAVWLHVDTIEYPGKTSLGDVDAYLDDHYMNLRHSVAELGTEQGVRTGYAMYQKVKHLVDLAAGLHLVDRDKDARNALVLIEKVMKLYNIDSGELENLSGYDMEKGVALYRSGKHQKAEDHFARAQNGKRHDTGYGGTRLALHRSLNYVAVGRYDMAVKTMDAEIDRLEKDDECTNRALGFAYMARADARLDGRIGDHGEADLMRAIELWKGPLRTSDPGGQRAMARSDGLMEEADRMLMEARLLTGERPDTDGIVRPPRSEAPRTMWDRADWHIPGTRKNATLLEDKRFNFDPETELKF